MTKCISALALLFLFNYNAMTQPLPNGRQYKVALFVPTGAELLDFAGPGEAFTQAPGFDVYLVSLTAEPIRSQGFMTITPNFSFRNCPQPDIIVIPGGGTLEIINEPEAMEWIKRHYKQGGMVLTVCTGAIVAAEAGLLKGKKATTYHNAFSRLQESCPSCELLPEARYVDNGRIITTAGISAGIDGALHLISRIKGKDVAEAAARNMEYDKWLPGEGHMNYTNEFVSYIRQHGLAGARKEYASPLEKSPHSLFYAGELKNLAADIAKAGQLDKAVEVLEFCALYYPGENVIYQQLRDIKTQLGQPVPPTPEAFMEKALKGEAKAVASMYEEAKAAFPGWPLFEESRMNWVGYQLLNQEKPEAAVAIFRLNARAYPESFNVWDSLAEGYMHLEEWDKARKFYNKSLELYPDNDNAYKMLAKMKGK